MGPVSKRRQLRCEQMRQLSQQSVSDVGSMIQRAHAHAGMAGMYSVAGVRGMPGLPKGAAADSCHLPCQDLAISSQALISLSPTHSHALNHSLTHTLSLTHLNSVWYTRPVHTADISLSALSSPKSLGTEILIWITHSGYLAQLTCTLLQCIPN